MASTRTTETRVLETHPDEGSAVIVDHRRIQEEFDHTPHEILVNKTTAFSASSHDLGLFARYYQLMAADQLPTHIPYRPPTINQLLVLYQDRLSRFTFPQLLQHHVQRQQQRGYRLPEVVIPKPNSGQLADTELFAFVAQQLQLHYHFPLQAQTHQVLAALRPLFDLHHSQPNTDQQSQFEIKGVMSAQRREEMWHKLGAENWLSNQVSNLLTTRFQGTLFQPDADQDRMLAQTTICPIIGFSLFDGQPWPDQARLQIWQTPSEVWRVAVDRNHFQTVVVQYQPGRLDQLPPTTDQSQPAALAQRLLLSISGSLLVEQHLKSAKNSTLNYEAARMIKPMNAQIAAQLASQTRLIYRYPGTPPNQRLELEDVEMTLTAEEIELALDFLWQMAHTLTDKFRREHFKKYVGAFTDWEKQFKPRYILGSAKTSTT